MREIVLNAINEDDLRQIIKEVLSENKESQTAKKNPDTTYLNRFEVADYLKISLPTLNNWTKKGIVQSYRIGNRVLYRKNEIESAVIATKNLKYKRG